MDYWNILIRHKKTLLALPCGAGRSGRDQPGADTDLPRQDFARDPGFQCELHGYKERGSHRFQRELRLTGIVRGDAAKILQSESLLERVIDKLNSTKSSPQPAGGASRRAYSGCRMVENFASSKKTGIDPPGSAQSDGARIRQFALAGGDVRVTGSQAGADFANTLVTNSSYKARDAVEVHAAHRPNG